ncbi:DUF3238 domain-containing protein [Brevibacillus laterosporus]|uniref:DUF3238 domain-containing protein n=1 Tax=Brevibacillus laterosporus TaxID=1465 RepID=UPI0003B1BCC1|nr:DUF3238 domain-containing protein [Brevibacillus laterosporus]ERM18315.1 hypothetical protein P615_17165 [Brevibacillus laterosporus PE36]
MSDILVKIKTFIPEENVKDPYGDVYEGDNRGFHFSGNYRTLQEFAIDFKKKTVKHTKRVGKTCRINPDEDPVCKRASDSELKMSEPTWKKDSVKFTASCGVSNPLSSNAPAIDYEFKITAYKKDGKVCISGLHDGFPNYEIWKKVGDEPPMPFYFFDHGDNTLLSLFPPMDTSVSLRCF